MNTRTIHIGILETGRPPTELAAQVDDYPAMVRKWLGDIDAQYSAYAVLDGEFPATASEAELWIITGSKFGAYDSHPWIARLEEFVRQARDAGKLMFGICFGHQIIAQALGGQVRRSDKGWGLGLHRYSTTNRWPTELGPAPTEIALQSFHQDQVEQVPDGAVTVASSPFCEHAALWYPGFALSVQGHPEFHKSYTATLLELRRNSVLQNADVDEALRSLDKDDTVSELAEIVKRHLVESLPLRD